MKFSQKFCLFASVIYLIMFFLVTYSDARMVRTQNPESQRAEPRIFLKKYQDIPKEGYLIKDVPFYKQVQRNYCGPAVLSMVLNYWDEDKNFTQEEIVKDIFDPTAEITNNSEMVFYPYVHNFRVISFNGNIERLKEIIQEDIPVIILQRVVGKIVNKGHYRVVVGYDDSRNLMIVHDPWFGENLSISYNVFSELWAFGEELNRKNWALIILPKEKENLLEKFDEIKNDAVTYHNIATALYSRKRIPESIEQWQKAIEISPEETTFYYCLSYACIQKGDYDEAVRYGKLSVEADKNSGFAYATLGWAYYKKGMLNEALRKLEKAMELNPDVGFIKEHYNTVKEEVNK